MIEEGSLCPRRVGGLRLGLLAVCALTCACERTESPPAAKRVAPQEAAGSDGGGSTEPEPTPTFHRDIAPLVFAHCAACHRPGEAGPFPLLTYQDVVKHDVQITDVTSSRYMPPWLPEPGFGEFEDTRRLSPVEIARISAWVDAGSPEGDPGDAPPRPEFPEGWQLGEPDLVLTMPEEYTLQASGTDVFRWFVWPVPVDQRRYVRGFEFRPGNARIVHHARILFDVTGRSLAREKEDPEPGFSGNMRLGEMRDPSGHWLGWTPGKQPTLRPKEFAWVLEPRTDIVLDTHLVPSGKEEPLRSSVGLYFSDEPPTRTPVIVRLGAKTMDIAPGDSNYRITDEYTLPVDVEVLNIYPHAHYLGKQMKGWAELPGGEREWLIFIKEWDFNWQDEYRYRSPLQLPAGTVLKLDYTYDNSAENPRNPSSPPRRVTYGWKTADEMGDMWLQVAPREPADREVLQRDFELKEMRLHIASFLKSLPENPDDYDTHHTLATCYTRTGQPDLAIRHFREAIRIQPDFAIAHHNLGIALQAAGKNEEAVDHIRKSIDLGVSDASQTRYTLGEAYRGLGDLDAAAREYRYALRLDSGNAQAHNILGVLLRRQGDAETAAVHYRLAMRADPAFAAPHYNLGNLLRAEGELEAAVAEYRRALAMRPEYVDALNNLALVLRALGRHEEALEHLRDVVRLAPEEANNWLNLGAALAQLGRMEQAIEKLREAIRLDPKSSPAHNGLGLALRGVGRCEEALAAFGSATRLRPGWRAPLEGALSCLDRVASEHAAAGRYRAALETAEQARRLAIQLGATDFGAALEKRMQGYRRQLESSGG